ncbi:MAG TPA: hypothetical protein VNZ86_03755, partial [Bacteroidia bacterium]|nr:hypothetical protein [Bacteroidia bacterium]
MNANRTVSLFAAGALLFVTSCKKESTTPSNTPPAPTPGVTYLHAVKVAASLTGVIAILSDQTVITSTAGAWFAAGNLSGITDVTCNSIALKNDGTVWMSDTTGHSFNWSMISGLTNIIAISSIPGTTTQANYALRSDGTVWAWGKNRYGEIGDSTFLTRNTPVQVKHLTGITAIATGLAHCLALKNDGTLWGWGQNFEGELGSNSAFNTSYPVPIQVVGYTGIVSIAAGNSTTYVLKNDGTVWASGVNGTGALGNGSTTATSTPVQVSGLTNVKTIMGGNSFATALRSDSTV